MDDDKFSPEETARRRDEVIRRMVNTPPQHRVSPSTQRKAKSSASRRPARKKRAKA